MEVYESAGRVRNDLLPGSTRRIGRHHSNHRGRNVADESADGNDVARRPGPSLHLLLGATGSVRDVLLHRKRWRDLFGVTLQRRQRGDQAQNRARWDNLDCGPDLSGHTQLEYLGDSDIE